MKGIQNEEHTEPYGLRYIRNIIYRFKNTIKCYIKQGSA